MREKLTKTCVDRLQPGATRIEVWDATCKGLYLRVEPSGRKSYMVYARAKDGRQIRKALGEHGQIGPETAREEAQKLIHEAKFGDPDKLARRAQGTITLRDLCQRYLDEHLAVVAARTKRHGSHTNAKIALLSGRLDGFLDRNVEALTVDALESHYKVLCRTSVSTANATFDNLKAAWNWGAPRLCPRANPAQFRRQPNAKRERFLFPSELQAFWQALQVYRVGADPHDQARADAVELMLLTGCRVAAAGSLELENVRQRDGVVILLEKGAKGRGATRLIRPITRRVGEVLGRRPVKDDVWAFPMRKGGCASKQSLRKLVQLVAKRAGIVGISPHVLRHTYATYAKAAPKQGLSLAEVSQVVGHSDTGVTARYVHTLSPIDAANAQSVEDYILGIALDGTNVVPLTRWG